MNPLLWVKGVLISAVVTAIFSTGWSWNGYRWEAKYTNLDETYKAFEADVQRVGDEQAKRSAEQHAADVERARRADNENATAKSQLAIALNSLRDAANGNGRGRLPEAPAGAIRPELACYDRAILGGAYGSLVAEVRGLADEGTASAVDLNTARKWAQGEMK